MALRLNHVHLKTTDPKQTAQFYVDTLGAKLIGEAGSNGYRLDLHGLMLNVTRIVPTQTREQHYGMEHIAIDTDAITDTVEKLKTNGAKVLEEMTSGDGRKIYFLEGPDGVQLELIEMRR